MVDNSWLFGLIVIIIILVVLATPINKMWKRTDQILELETKNYVPEEVKLQQSIDNYLRIKNALPIPTNPSKVALLFSSYTSIFAGTTLIWKANDSLNYFPDLPNISNYSKYTDESIMIHSLPLDKIEYFEEIGQVFTENKISGGGGGGSSLLGAVVGGVIAGAPGAIIGSRRGVKEIKSELIAHDTRVINLQYFKEDNVRNSEYFAISAFQVLNDLIPEKEINIVKAIKSSQIIQNQIGTSITDNKQYFANQIRELAKLRDEGILTEDEFTQKKKALLDKIG